MTTRRHSSRRIPALAIGILSIAYLSTWCCADNTPVPDDSSEAAQYSPVADETTDERLSRIIREYDAQGIHRTGTDVDQESARWLAAEVRHAGFAPALESLTIRRVDPVNAYVEIGDRRIEGIPLVDSGKFTDDDGIVGQPGIFGSDAVVGYGRLPPGASVSPIFHQLRTESQHSMILVATGSDHLPPGFALINADRFRDPVGKPVLQLPSEAFDSLAEADKNNTPVRAVIEVERTETEVYNVTTTVEGSNPELPPIVVMTPRSGWWTCAAERGGGIALWVELLHVLRENPPARTVHFIASTGHELGHVGLDHYLDRRDGLIQNAHLWLHLGANFATAVRPGVLLQASDQEFRNLGFNAMQAEEVPPDQQTPIGKRPRGEARNIHDGGGRYISLLGRSGVFHTPEDRWPDAVDMEKLSKQTRAVTSVILTVSQ